jgi:tetratricopeptide (TPR) repeat protein
MWCYGFNHDEAIVCFSQAIALDADCAMAYWGLAFASGPNYNMEWSFYTNEEMDEMVATCHPYIQGALARLDGKSVVEVALVKALARRFQASVIPTKEDFALWNDAYAVAMQTVYAQFPDDPDVITLTADALLGRTPWQLWDIYTGEPAEGADTLLAKEILEKALSNMGGKPAHAGILHMYIHLMEMSPFPELALPASDALRDLVPDVGHLRHMPAHIDILCGHYHNAIVANEKAHVANELYAENAGKFNQYTLYRCHDLHFMMYAGMMLGNRAKTMWAAQAMVAAIPPDLIRKAQKKLGETLEGFVAMKVHAYIRFGEWQQIIDEPLPADPELYCLTTALLHYAKGVAHAASGNVPAAQAEKALFEVACQQIAEDRFILNNYCSDILAVARAMLDGELAYRQGHYETAFTHLRRSALLHDNLKYTEPWVWMQPTRHALGALLLEQGHIGEAKEIYKSDLGLNQTISRALQHPNNVWSLHGYAECLRRSGENEEATQIETQLAEIMVHSDVEIYASCFCRTAHHCCD